MKCNQFHKFSLVCVKNVCIAWCRTGAYYTANLTFSHDFPIQVWGAYYTSVRIIFEVLRYDYDYDYYNQAA